MAVQWATAFNLAGSVGAWCVSSPQPSHFTLSASWRAEMSGNNPSNIFPPQPSGCNTTCAGIYLDLILDRQQKKSGIHLNAKANIFNCSDGAQIKWALEAVNTNAAQCVIDAGDAFSAAGLPQEISCTHVSLETGKTLNRISSLAFHTQKK